MVKEFKYCDNPNAEVPKMFIDKDIGGKDKDGVPNIDGNLFLRELMYISDVLGKSKEEVWINSPGGIVTEGQSIYAAILESKCNVDTVCYGIAASIAGVIFQAGKKRIMMDYAHLMYHPAYSEDGKADKGLIALNNAICIMIATRTGKTEDEIWAIMNRGRVDDKGTWISAKEALEMGFCDEVRKSDARNSIESESINAVWKSANKIYNRIIEQPKINKMSKVLNKALGLHEEASEEAAITAFNALNKKMDDLQTRYDNAVKTMDALNAEMDEFKKAKAKADDDAKNKADDDDKKAKAKADDDCKNAAEVAITDAVKSGKIKNDASIIAKYKASYIANPELTKDLIDELPINRIAPSFKAVDESQLKDTDAEAAARKNGLKPGTGAWYNYIALNTKK